MNKKDVEVRIKKLRKLIHHHRYLYHVLDRQEISDAVLDSLKKELFELEQQFPDLVSPDSPTQRVAGKPLEKFEKVSHSQPMYSLNDAFSQKDMEDWIERISKLLTKEEVAALDFYCELKIDGLAVELTYEKGMLTVGSTRGDGIIGENVTQNLKTIEAIPLKLREKEETVKGLQRERLPAEIITLLARTDLFNSLVARGEVFIPKREFEKVNEEQKKAGLSLYANPRNLAAGSVRQLDAKITTSRKLDSFVYDFVADVGQATHEQKHLILQALGFKIDPRNRYCKNLKEVIAYWQQCQKIRENVPYEIDGIVVIVNQNRIFEKLGVVGKAPRGAIAFKFPAHQATTIIEDIQVQVGRTGVLTPVAHLKPVQVAGVTISRATLHNEDEVHRLGVRIGDTVIVGRAGDVIPDIIKVLPELRTGKEKEFRMPLMCPVCGGKVVKEEGGVVARCVNSNCFAKNREYFYHFVSKGAFDIQGLGPKIVDQLLEEGLVVDPSDLFELEEGDLLPLERFGEKSAKKLVESIRKGKRITLPKFIYALGIRNVGIETATDLADHFVRLEKIQNADFEALQKIKDVGPVVAQSIAEWFLNGRNRRFIEKLHKVGIDIEDQKPPARNQKLKGLQFVLTGILEAMSRERAKERIVGRGGHVTESLSRNTDYVVVGKEPGLKYTRAKKLGVKILSEKEFLAMIDEKS